MGKGMLKELSDKYEVIGLSSPGASLKVVGEREGVKTIAVPMERHISLWNDFKSLLKLIRVFRIEKPDMVHSMTPKAGLLCMLAAWLIDGGVIPLELSFRHPRNSLIKLDDDGIC